MDAEAEILGDLCANVDALRAEVARWKEDANRLGTQVACAADLLNTWLRELNVPEVKRPWDDLELRSGIDRAWEQSSRVRGLLTAEVERLRGVLDSFVRVT